MYNSHVSARSKMRRRKEAYSRKEKRTRKEVARDRKTKWRTALHDHEHHFKGFVARDAICCLTSR